jgi:probable phosphoglycerate mutase
VLILVRHGRTAANAQGLLQGRLDVPLDELGLAQAAAVAAAVGPVDRIIASPLQRTRQTAAAFGGVAEIDDRWIELDYGDLEGAPMASVGFEVWDRWRDDAEFVPAHGESIATLSTRVHQACEELVADASRRDVVVVSHVSPVKAAVMWALGASAELSWRTHLDQASITRIGFGRYGPVLRSYNETSHLPTPPGPPILTG